MACSLCEALRGRASDPDFILDAPNLSLFKGPFQDRWPGAVMAVHRATDDERQARLRQNGIAHARELTELYGQTQSAVAHELIGIEKAVRVATRCARMNVVKFGNVCDHLHWHFIPRSADETARQKNPWELQGVPVTQLYASGAPSTVSFEPLARELHARTHHPAPPFFATALILRPASHARPADFAQWPLDRIIPAARAHPDAWECYLMKRNYLDRSWDTFGGGADPREFPLDTLKREVSEELGWTVTEAREVLRQWTFGQLRGFVFVVRPEEPSWFEDVPHRRATDEVESARYFPLTQLASDPLFSNSVQGRIRAFALGLTDFERQDLPQFDCENAHFEDKITPFSTQSAQK